MIEALFYIPCNPVITIVTAPDALLSVPRVDHSGLHVPRVAARIVNSFDYLASKPECPRLIFAPRGDGIVIVIELKR
jgi:hypothetical protein